MTAPAPALMTPGGARLWPRVVALAGLADVPVLDVREEVPLMLVAETVAMTRDLARRVRAGAPAVVAVMYETERATLGVMLADLVLGDCEED